MTAITKRSKTNKLKAKHNLKKRHKMLLSQFVLFMLFLQDKIDAMNEKMNLIIRQKQPTYKAS